MKLLCNMSLVFGVLYTAISCGSRDTKSYSLDNVDSSYPTCRISSSDPDGDGWGWENSQSCKVASDSYPKCRLSSSDPDGDGWGWENSQSCRVTSDNHPETSRIFKIEGRNLIDPSGEVFIARGVNVPFAYYKDRSYNALPLVKSMGFNSVRIVWCADTKTDKPGTCNPQYHFHRTEDLRMILERIRELKLVAVFNLQNATGSNDRKDLQLMADYIMKPDVKEVLMEYKDIILINIANEWYGRWDKDRTYIEAYRDVITQLRRSGLPHVLVVDARGYGQDVSSIYEYVTEISNIDKNVIMSAHLYETFSESQKVREFFAKIRDLNAPLLIGEFGCSHGKDSNGKLRSVACDVIMDEANMIHHKIGTFAWSFTGNSSNLSDLDVVEFDDWRTVTEFGKRVLDSENGVKNTSKESSHF